jgi:hypothetical protein
LELDFKGAFGELNLVSDLNEVTLRLEIVNELMDFATFGEGDLNFYE